MAASLTKTWCSLKFVKKQVFVKNADLICASYRSTYTGSNELSENQSRLLEHSVGSDAYSRLIPKTIEEIEAIKNQPVLQPPNPHILHVALLGLPNSGKSTLTNQLMGWRVCSVSSKAHTTRQKNKAIFVEKNKQIIFVDTPGLVSLGDKNRFNLNDAMTVDPENSVKEADLAIALVDASNKFTRLKIDPKMLRLLRFHKNKKSILVLNKVDLLKSKNFLLDVVYSLTNGIVGGQPIVKKHSQPFLVNKPKSGSRIIRETLQKLNMTSKVTSDESDDESISDSWPHFDRVFMVSAKLDDGINDLRRYILDSAKPGSWVYPSAFVTDQAPADIVIMAVREKLLDNLPQEIPYILNLKLEMFEVDQYGVLRVVVEIGCPREGLMKLVIGGAGKKISQLAEETRQALMNTFRCELTLKLIVVHQKATN